MASEGSSRTTEAESFLGVVEVGVLAFTAAAKKGDQFS